jgi:hypothetical protein
MGKRAAHFLALVGALLAGCHPPPDDVAPSVYVGALGADGDASLAVAVQDGYVAVYACGSDSARDAYPRWVSTGTYTDESHVTLTRGQWRFDGAWGGATASGALVGPDGVAMPWSGIAARPGSLDGLYAALDSGCMSGVIVMNGDSAPVVRGAWCDAAGDVRQINPILPLTLEGTRLAVEVAAGAAPRRLNVAPVRLPMP